MKFLATSPSLTTLVIKLSLCGTRKISIYTQPPSDHPVEEKGCSCVHTDLYKELDMEEWGTATFVHLYIYTLNLKLLPRIYLYSISSFVKGGWWGWPTPSFWVDNIVFAFRICLPHHGQLLRSNEPSPKKTPRITPAGILLSRPSPSFPIALQWPIHICSHALIINPVGKTKLPPPLSFKSLFQWICSLPNLNSWF